VGATRPVEDEDSSGYNEWDEDSNW
jgi:hypothetical protein